MDIRHLKYFIAISEERSLSAAAQRLRVAQPSLSQHVIKLEEELGVSLVCRSPRGILLTEEGHLLARHAREIVHNMDDCIEEMKAAGGIVQGQVTFGMPPSVSMVMSVPLAETIRVECPSSLLPNSGGTSGYGSLSNRARARRSTTWASSACSRGSPATCARSGTRLHAA